MPRPIQPQSVASSVYSTLSAVGSPVAKTLRRIERSVPRPVDSPCLLAVCRGVRNSIQAAFATIGELNDKAEELLADLDALVDACSAAYAERGLVDSLETLDRRLTEFRGWSTFAILELNQIPTTNARVVACGMEIGCKLVTQGNPAVAHAFMRDLAKGRIDLDLTVKDFLSQIHFNFLEPDSLPPWYARSKKNYYKFCSFFSKTPPPPPPPPTLEERAAAQWRAHAAYPNFRQRAAVLDKTTLSALQIEHAINLRATEVFSQPGIYKAMFWFAGFTGLNFETLADIPLLTNELSYWRICIDLQRGLLLRDYACLVPDSAEAKSNAYALPASFVVCTPIPVDVLATLLLRHSSFATGLTLGDLVPEMIGVSSRSLLYKTVGDIPPTWARWVRTVGRFARQRGIDNLLTSVVVGNLGNTAKSKYYYCNISHAEIWKVCRDLNVALKFGEPVPMPSALLNFGTGVVPTPEMVRNIDQELAKDMEALRRTGKCSAQEAIQFHNAYTRIVGFRFCCLLALRESGALGLHADMGEERDRTLDIDDKTSAGKAGALPVVFCNALRELAKAYRKHCIALCARLERAGGFESACDWLNSVVASEHVPLLCTISRNRKCIPLSTTDVLATTVGLAPDFGRKLLENWMRQQGFITRDIDRMLRHEVQGQESYSSVTWHDELAWVGRVQPALDELAQCIFASPLFGFRSK